MMNLEQKLVRIKPIRRKRWAGEGRYPGSRIVLTTPISSMTGSYVTGLSQEDRLRLEKELGVDLSPSRTNKFWQELKAVFAEGTDKILDLNDPLSEIEYLMLKNHKLVANNNDEKLSNPKTIFIIEDLEKEADIKNSLRVLKAKAYGAYANLSPEEMRDILAVLGKYDMVKTASPKIVSDRLGEFLDGGKSNQEKFIQVVEDKDKAHKVFLNKLISYKILRKNGPAIYYGEDIIAHDFESAVTYIKDSKNSSIRKALFAALEEFEEDSKKIKRKDD